jgi:RND superfamily putative drug exporter
VAAFLYRLGRLAFRRRWYVVVVWLAVLGGAGLASSTVGDLSDDAAMPATARVVFVAPVGKTVTDYRAAIDTLVDDVSRGGQVAAAIGPFQAHAVSRDGSTAYATITYTATPDDLTDATKDHLRDAVARVKGLTVEVGGPVLASKPKVGGVSEIVGVVLAALVLLVTFGSPVAAGLPLLTAMLGVGVSTFAIIAFGGVFGLSSSVTTLATMLGLAVGIDYALFVVSRYREERAAGHAPEESAGRAVGTAGSAVVFAGLTVIVALAGLTVLGIPTAAQMGVTAAGAIVVSVLVALTLVPALLGFCPNAVLARKRVRPTTKEGAGARWARFVLRRPVLVLLASVAALVVLAIPATRLQLGMPGDESKSTATTERRAYRALAEGFGPGFNGPLVITANIRDAKAVRARIADTPGVVFVSSAKVDRGTALFTAIPATAPTDERTKDLVERIRDEQPAIRISGLTAVNIDLAEKVRHALVPYFALVLGLAFLLLLVVFRSLLVPLKAVCGFLLSVLAALGLVVAVFQWGWGADAIGLPQTGPIISLMPIVLMGMIFGLAMDYEVFLVSRMREAHIHGEPARAAVVTGFRHSARVVVAAALIMIAVFSGFVGADLAMIKMIGFGLATAVLLDAFVVRMTIVPAVLAILGERAWALPRWLDRLLPHVDVEGTALRADTMEPDHLGRSRV